MSDSHGGQIDMNRKCPADGTQLVEASEPSTTIMETRLHPRDAPW